MTILEILNQLSTENGGIITTQKATEHGISRSILSKLCNQGKIERIKQGQYIIPGEMEDELLSISLRSVRLIFSHETALFLHGLSDRMPFVHSATAPSNSVPPLSLRDDIKFYYIKPTLFEMGKEIIKTPAGNDVNCYDIDRTICDALRSRNRIGSETFMFALKAYTESNKKNLNHLQQYAKALNISGLVYRYMEVLL